MRRLPFGTIHDMGLMLDQEQEGRERSLSAAVIDSQSVKAPAAERRRFDAANKVSVASATSRPIQIADC